MAGGRRVTTPIHAWLDPAGCPRERPVLAEMGAATRELHVALDAHARRTGVPWLHPEHRTIQRDLLGSPNVVAWQEAKAAFLLRGDGAWSELPHLYARYGTPGTGELIAALRGLEGARAAIVTDCGMQAVALVTDALLTAGGHAVVMRQVYNKTRTFIEHSARAARRRDHAGRRRRSRRAARRDPARHPAGVRRDLHESADPRAGRPGARRADPRHLVIDSTIATPWAFAAPLLARGARVVVGSLTKALGGQDAALGGYIATDDAELANQLMDLVAMRGGILDDDRARRIADGLRGRRWQPRAAVRHRRPARRVPRPPPADRARVPPVAARPPRRRRDRARLSRAPARCSRSGCAGADEARHRAHRRRPGVVRRAALRAVVRRPRHQGQPPPHGVGVLHATRPGRARSGSTG